MVALAAVVTLAGAWLLHTTRFGRRTFAVGSNAEAARRAGIPVQGHLVRVYTGVGLLSGLAGFMSLAYFGTTTISGHSTDNLNAIAAVVLGGTSLFGGVGTVFGTVIGVFIPAVLTKGFVIVGVQQFWQPVAISAVLVAAVWFDQVRRRSRDSR
jgi:ribose transport system permease protein